MKITILDGSSDHKSMSRKISNGIGDILNVETIDMKHVFDAWHNTFYDSSERLTDVKAVNKVLMNTDIFIFVFPNWCESPPYYVMWFIQQVFNKKSHYNNGKAYYIMTQGFDRDEYESRNVTSALEYYGIEPVDFTVFTGLKEDTDKDKYFDDKIKTYLKEFCIELIKEQ